MVVVVMVMVMTTVVVAELLGAVLLSAALLSILVVRVWVPLRGLLRELPSPVLGVVALGAARGAALALLRELPSRVLLGVLGAVLLGAALLAILVLLLRVPVRVLVLLVLLRVLVLWLRLLLRLRLVAGEREGDCVEYRQLKQAAAFIPAHSRPLPRRRWRLAVVGEPVEDQHTGQAATTGRARRAMPPSPLVSAAGSRWSVSGTGSLF
jgi:hypothetical protein